MAKKKESEAPMEEELVSKSEDGGIVNTIWNFFSSMKLGIALLIVIAGVSIFGTLMKPDATGNVDYNVFYGSWWFRTLLFLLTMNLVVCSISRLRPILRAMEPLKPDVSDNFVKRLKNVRVIKTKTTTSGAEGLVEKALSSQGYRVNAKRDEEKVKIAADKGRLGVWGSFISHIAFVVIVIGAIIGNIYGFNGFINELEGESFSLGDVQGIQHVDPGEYFDVKVNKFWVEFRPTGMPKDYFSDLSVIQNGEEKLRKTIQVNDPLKYNGFVFYQASYGQINATSGSFTPASGSAQPFTLNEGDYTQIPGTDLAVKFVKFIPDYDPNYGMETKSPDPNNPAVVYQVFKGQQQIAMDVAKIKAPVKVENGTLTFDNYSAKFYTGLEVKRDPGVPVVWLGCGLLVFGMTLSFVLQQRKVWAIISEENGRAVVEIGGVTMKNKMAFEREFQQVVQNIQENN